jgi:hypothetical protein
VYRLSIILLSITLVGAVHGKESIKLSIGQYRILDDADSYNFTSVSAKYSTSHYRARLTLPYISEYLGESGLGNASIKLSYLTQWQKTFIDFNYRQKLATADERLTVPVRDTGMSIELSRYISGGIGFFELGYTWRNEVQSSESTRNDSLYYALGGLLPLSDDLLVGLTLDHKPTALGRLDRSAGLITQYKVSHRSRLGFNVTKGLTTTSPDWLVGLVLSHKY